MAEQSNSTASSTPTKSDATGQFSTSTMSFPYGMQGYPNQGYPQGYNPQMYYPQSYGNNLQNAPVGSYQSYPAHYMGYYAQSQMQYAQQMQQNQNNAGESTTTEANVQTDNEKVQNVEASEEKHEEKEKTKEKKNEKRGRREKKRNDDDEYDDEVDDDGHDQKRAKKDESTQEEKAKEPGPEWNVEVSVVWPEDSKIEPKEDEALPSLFGPNEKQYQKVLVDGETYAVGDTVALWPEERVGQGPMGTIKTLWTNGESNNFECQWFYTLEETILGGNRRHKVGEREVFLSTHSDENAVESIAKKVTIKYHGDITEEEMKEFISKPDCYYYKKKYNHLDKCFEDIS